MKVPMRPIMQALEFQISAVLVKPRNGSVSFGSTFGFSNYMKPSKVRSKAFTGSLTLKQAKFTLAISKLGRTVLEKLHFIFVLSLG
jgi:hypothetical protein